MDDSESLPYFPQRDDGLLYWELIGDYVRDYLEVFYGTPGSAQANAAVESDYELQAWAAELSQDACGQGNLAGFPACFTSFEQLHQALQRIIFTLGPHHASLNFAQLQYGGYIPNMPALLSLPPSQGNFDERDLLNTMPPMTQANLQNEMTYKAAYWMGYFLGYEDFFCGGGKNNQARHVVKNYQGRLKEIKGIIEARNLKRREDGNLAYDLLLPANVPNSVSA